MKVEQDEFGLAEAELDLRAALNMLTYTSHYRYDWYDWLWLAGIIEVADKAIRRAREKDPSIEVPLFEAVMQEFRVETDNFRNVEFQRATRAIRRRCRDLFRIPRPGR